MCALSHNIRENPNWWEKVKDKATVKKWGQEALRQEGGNEESSGGTSRISIYSRKPTSAKELTPTMVNFCSR